MRAPKQQSEFKLHVGAHTTDARRQGDRELGPGGKSDLPPEQFNQLSNSDASPPLLAPEKQIARWEAITASTKPLFLDIDHLTLNSAIATLLELSPTRVEAVNRRLATFIERLQNEEIKNAFILEKQDGSEEIVVAAFDRSSLLKTFRDSIADEFGEAVGDFMVGQMRYDPMLAVGMTEMRFFIERTPGGQDAVVFQRKVDRPKGPPLNLRTEEFVSSELHLRYRQLFDAAPGFPRKRQQE